MTKALKADKNRRFDKIIDPNGKKIYSKKLEAVDPSLNTFMNKFYQKHGDLMKELDNK